MTNLLPDNLFPDRIKDLLHAISRAGFFDRSVVIGSWVMLIYQELFGAGNTGRSCISDHPFLLRKLTLSVSFCKRIG